jgi:hypothetical protein
VFDPIDTRTLEHLVPPDHYFRRLERSLDLSFVRDASVKPGSGME